MEVFDAAWLALAELGHCDAPGGAEYHRVLEEWENRGHMLACLMFIRWAANSCPPPSSREERTTPSS